MGAGTWALCFIHCSFELHDYAYVVVRDRFAWRCAPEHRGAIRGGAGGGCFIPDYIPETPPPNSPKKRYMQCMRAGFEMETPPQMWDAFMGEMSALEEEY